MVVVSLLYFFTQKLFSKFPSLTFISPGNPQPWAVSSLVLQKGRFPTFDGSNKWYIIHTSTYPPTESPDLILDPYSFVSLLLLACHWQHLCHKSFGWKWLRACKLARLLHGAAAITIGLLVSPPPSLLETLLVTTLESRPIIKTLRYLHF